MANKIRIFFIFILVFLIFPVLVKGACTCSPVKVGGTYTSGETWGIAISGQYAYTTNEGGLFSDSLEIFDISNPTNPFKVGGTRKGTGNSGDIAVSNNYAYVATGNINTGGLDIFSISDPTNPIAITGVDIPYNQHDVAISGNYAYVIGTRVDVFDISDPVNPLQVGSANPGGSLKKIAISGQYAYIARVPPENLKKSLKILDISNPRNPRVVRSVRTLGNNNDVVISGQYAYVTTSNNLEIFDISDPLNPFKVGGIQTSGNTRGVTVSGDYAYIINDDVSGSNDLEIFDISDPVNPFKVDTIGIEGGGNNIISQNNYLYIVSYPTGDDLEIFDISSCRITAEICTDNLDNDCDGLFDCADSDCAGQADPVGAICCQTTADCSQDECVIESCVINVCSYTDRIEGDGTECPVDQFCDAPGGSCVLLPPPPPVINITTYWSDDGINEISELNVNIGTTIVKLVLEDSGLPEGTEVNFDIYEDDTFLDDFIRTVNANVINGTVIAEWTITQEDIDKTSDYGEFYFEVNGEVSSFLSITLVEELSSVIYWADIIGNPINAINASIGNTIVELVLKDSGLPEGTEVNFDIYEDDTFLDDFIRTVNANVINGTVIAEWTITQEDIDKTSDYGEFYFEVNGEVSSFLSITFVEGLNCNEVVTCLDYTDQSLCENDNALCQVASDSIPEDVDCNDPLIECFCSWNVSGNVCNPSFTVSEMEIEVEIEIGTCTYTSETGDNCDDGFLSYSWTADWDGTPESRPLECVDGSRTIECPAQIQLGFFGIYNFIVTALIIAVIYILLILRGRKFNPKVSV